MWLLGALSDSQRAAVHVLAIRTPEHAIATLNWMCQRRWGRYVGTDALLDALVDIYAKNVPSDAYLQQMSLLQQQYAGSGGVEDYALSTLWIASQIGIMNSLQGQARTEAAAGAERGGRRRARACLWFGGGTCVRYEHCGTTMS